MTQIRNIYGFSKNIVENYKFVEIIESELLSLHEGNCARYNICPLEFKQWKKVWSKNLKGSFL